MRLVTGHAAATFAGLTVSREHYDAPKAVPLSEQTNANDARLNSVNN